MLKRACRMSKVVSWWIVVLALVIVCPAQALAQDDDDNDTERLITTTLVVAPLTTTTYLVRRFLEKLTDKKLEEVRLYLDHNAVALARDVTLGGGPTVVDLAQWLHLRPQQLPRFARRLRHHRASFLALLANPERDDRAVVALLTRLAGP